MDEPDFAGLAQARVAIAGLGLMGGSLALALRGHCRALVGFDANPAVAAEAVRRKVVDQAAEDLAAAAECEVLVLAAPVRAILEQIEQLSAVRPAGRVVVLDLGSTKADIVAAMENLPGAFDPVGGHPMCGKEVSGLAHAEAGLFRERVFVLSPLARTSARALGLARALAAAVGAQPWVLAAADHDRLAAFSSHLPYTVAAALVRAAQAEGDERVWTLAASGFRDTSRLAGSDVTMMLDILLTNRQAVLHALAAHQAEVERLARALEAADTEALRAWLDEARTTRQGLFPSRGHTEAG